MSDDMAKKDSIKNKAYEVVALLLSVALFAGGIYGVVSSRVSAQEYKKSTDIRKVTAVVTYAKDIGDDDDYEDCRYWTKLSFSVDGSEYKGTKTFYRTVCEGDDVTVEVYRTSSGRYKLTPDGNPIYFLFSCIAIPVGGFIAVAMFSAVFFKNPDKKAKKDKTRRSGK